MYEDEMFLVFTLLTFVISQSWCPGQPVEKQIYFSGSVKKKMYIFAAEHGRTVKLFPPFDVDMQTDCSPRDKRFMYPCRNTDTVNNKFFVIQVCFGEQELPTVYQDDMEY